MRLLRLVGRHAAGVMLFGMVIVALLPGVSSDMRPWLPVLVSLVLGLAIARLDVGPVLRDLAQPKPLAILVGLLIGFVPVTCVLLAFVMRLLGFAPDTVLAAAVFGASPPISSAASIALLLGYNARITLQFGLLAMLTLPLLGPFSLGLAGIETATQPLRMATQIAGMVAGGFAIGLALQAVIGKARIAAESEAFNGAAALAMIAFLFPLFDGVGAFAAAQPFYATGLLILALVLNFGGHVLVSNLALHLTDPFTARAAGLMFGNRNISIFLAVLPANPALGLFIAAAQIPIYATPAVFGRLR